MNAAVRKPKSAAVAPKPAGKTAARQAPKVSAKVPATAKAPAAAKAGGKARKPELPEAQAVPLPVETVVDAVRPAYWDEACADLMKRDRILRKMIPTYGPAHLVSRGDPFITLARSIVGQQISVKAAQSVWERLVTLCPRVTPAQCLKAGTDQLAGCGLSKRKAEYITDQIGRAHV